MASSDQEQSGAPDGSTDPRRPRTFLGRNKKIIVWVTIYVVLVEIAFLIAPQPVSAALAFANKILGVFDWAFIGVQSVADNMAASRVPARTALSIHMFMVIWVAAYFVLGRTLVKLLSGATEELVDESGTAHERIRGFARHMTPPPLKTSLALMLLLALASIIFVLSIAISRGYIDQTIGLRKPWGFGESFIGIAYFVALVVLALGLLEVLIVGSFLTLRRKNKTTNAPQ